MPKKLLPTASLPTLVQERLSTWGKSIRAQRLLQRITAEDLSARMGVSEATLRRLENGDPGAGAGVFLTALLTLGIADEATPPLPPALWADTAKRRVKLSRDERGAPDADYF